MSALESLWDLAHKWYDIANDENYSDHTRAIHRDCANQLENALAELAQPKPFPCVVDSCSYECVSVDDLNQHSNKCHREPWTGADGVTLVRYPGADAAGDFMWHETVRADRTT